MADKEERKKKKKSKKTEEVAEEAPAEDEQWPPADVEEDSADPEAADGEEGAALEGGEEAPGEDNLADEFPESLEKKKSPFPMFWDRPKARLYGMNFDYGENYYRDMMDYLNNRSNLGYRCAVPPPAKSWAERAHRSASQRYPKQNSDINALLSNIRSNIRSYENHHRQYTANIQTVYGPKAI